MYDHKHYLPNAILPPIQKIVGPNLTINCVLSCSSCSHGSFCLGKIETFRKKTEYDSMSASLGSNLHNLEQEVRDLRETAQADESRHHFLMHAKQV